MHWYDTKLLKHFLQIDLENIVITNSPDKDMIVADHMNQVNLSCEAEGNSSVSWYSPIVTLTVSIMVYTHLL
jgi:hypothetical protein